MTFVGVFLCLAIYAGAFEGLVVDSHSGSPIQSADVSVLRDGNVVEELETDENGRFRTSDLSSGEYRVEVSRSNYLHAFVQMQERAPAVVRLIRRSVICGRVTDVSNQPVPGADVLAMTRSAVGDWLRVFGNPVRTDEAGEYRLSGLPPGSYAVAVSYGASTRAVGRTGSAVTDARLGSGFLFYPGNSRPEFFIVSGGDEYRNIDFTIQPVAASAVKGKVVGAPSGDRFWLALTPRDQPALAVAVTETGPDDSFGFEGVPTGAYDLFASGPASGRTSAGAVLDNEPLFGHSGIEVGGSDLGDISVAVGKGSTVTFLLRPDASCPAAATLQLIPVEDRAAWTQLRVVLTAGAGRSLNNVAPGRYALNLSTPGNACYLSDDNVLAVPTTKTVGLRVAPGGSIRGHTAEAGIVLLSDDETTWTATPDVQNQFTFTGLRPGRYWVSGRRADGVEVEVKAGTSKDVEIP